MTRIQPKFSDLLGKTLTAIEGASVGSERITFRCADGLSFILYHLQDCCESVSVNDIVGRVEDLLGSPLTMADESSSGDRPESAPKPEYEPESQTWTFYKLATVKGFLDIRWFGESNGYYSESVYFDQEPR